MAHFNDDASEQDGVRPSHHAPYLPQKATVMADQINEEYLKTALRARLQAEHVEITDVSGGCGQAFTAIIVSPQFAGLNSLKRHRLVNAALREEIASIHAWSAKCYAPDEWARAPKQTQTNDAVVGE